MNVSILAWPLHVFPSIAWRASFLEHLHVIKICPTISSGCMIVFFQAFKGIR